MAWHVNPTTGGHGRCGAQSRATCPYASETNEMGEQFGSQNHFETREEAEKAGAEIMMSKHGVLGGLSFDSKAGTNLSDLKLLELTAGGVDKWQFYDEAIRAYREDNEKDEADTLSADEILEALENNNVENWDGYGKAMRHYTNYESYVDKLPKEEKPLDFDSFQNTTDYKLYTSDTDIHHSDNSFEDWKSEVEHLKEQTMRKVAENEQLEKEKASKPKEVAPAEDEYWKAEGYETRDDYLDAMEEKIELQAKRQFERMANGEIDSLVEYGEEDWENEGYDSEKEYLEAKEAEAQKALEAQKAYEDFMKEERRIVYWP